ncbi:MAG: alpha-galactosidase [Oscillospiraceae bacterium]|nr:alpha-galactosidase [Oscillospiraceae bacterium]
MSITYQEQSRIFKLDTPRTSYIMGIEDSFGYLLHYYYGRRLHTDNVRYLSRTGEPPYTPERNDRDKLSFLDCAPFEYPMGGIGDFREHCLEIRTAGGHNAVEAGYRSHRIFRGKATLPGLPATFAEETECESLVITLADEQVGLEIDLQYAVFEGLDVITRSVCIRNVGQEPVYLTKVLSLCLDMDNRDYSLLTLHGSWARERRIHSRKLGYGRQGVFSERGESSHQEHPFLALTSPNISQTAGEVYGFHFVYSGNFHGQCGVDQFGSVRTVLGINPYNFTWKLEQNGSFQTPEAVMVYSAEGLGHMTRTFHDLYRRHLIRSPWKNRKRPILINNWEATYFDFNTEKLLAIAREAAAAGIEMLVMDDGWFGNRFDDNRALGDWFVNEQKLPGGLACLVQQVNQMGLKFGIWMEPEMISPDSDLYRAHPDWAIAVPGRRSGLCRNQYVLDITRPEVLDYVWGRIEAILSSANIEYLKWDMNRQLADLGSLALPADRQGELYHRYVLAVYELQERLVRRFPELLLENCSGGGARFDPGMLYYSPQIWCSDDTDAIERLRIQEGTALIYPLSAIGAHVSDCPNHAVGRITPFETRGHVALAGTFGYELDITRIPEEDRRSIPGQVAMYHRYNDLIREGDYYRLASFTENGEIDCWQVTARDGSESLVTVVQVLNRPNYHSRRICLQGLKEQAHYRVEETGEVFGGDVLMYAGLPVANFWGDFRSRLYTLVRIN